MSVYLPPPEKLTKLGFVPHIPNAAPRGAKGYAAHISEAWICRSTDTARLITIVRPSGTVEASIHLEYAVDLSDGSGWQNIGQFSGRLRSEAEFDLLLWQVRWTHAEPTLCVVGRDFMLPG